MKEELKLIKLSEVQEEEIKWIWYPYIPYGKVTIIQGDPGEGKTTFVLSLIALLTTGTPLPEEETATEPITVIYQTAEDGLGDTIKPRLLSTGADLEKVIVIDENEIQLTLSDERLEQAIKKTSAKLIVLDPIQAYLGAEVDMHRANEIRPIMKRLSLIAERTGCAVILIGHMNKMGGAKSAYRGLGSIDIRAAVRSVLVVGRVKDEPTLRIVAHDKSSLAPEGKSIAFELNPDTGFRWKGYCETSVDDLLSGRGSVVSKTTQAENLLKEILADGELSSEEITNQAKELDISNRTLKIAKQNLGVKSFRKGDKWYSSLPRG
ncbi:AAA family ATPase [Chakrabartyella piscis]|uniref:AAA family ATPase n=1 Tax=Chakrabartyella piscis TaxID=2918914 RepID=UPI00295862B0|nr:AAA family ATPase [Chakrabartyella piscis]